MALKILMQAKIACANSIHDLETLDGITDDWPDDQYLAKHLTNAALDIHLHCEAAIKECHAVIDLLDTLMADQAGPPAAHLVEMECRQELAVTEVQAIWEIIKDVEKNYSEKGTELATLEMEKRCKIVLAKLKILKEKIESMQSLLQSMSSPQEVPPQEQVEGEKHA